MDPHQNVMDPEHCLIHKVSSEKKLEKGNNNAIMTEIWGLSYKVLAGRTKNF